MFYSGFCLFFLRAPGGRHGSDQKRQVAQKSRLINCKCVLPKKKTQVTLSQGTPAQVPLHHCHVTSKNETNVVATFRSLEESAARKCTKALELGKTLTGKASRAGSLALSPRLQPKVGAAQVVQVEAAQVEAAQVKAAHVEARQWPHRPQRHQSRRRQGRSIKGPE